MAHITVDKQQAKYDAQTLFNGDVDSALEHDEPAIEEIPTHPEDGEEDVSTLRIVHGGEFTMAEVPPIERQPNWDFANAVKRAGFHIWGLLQENEMLLAAQGKDAAEQRNKLLVALKKLREEHRQVLRYLNMAMRNANVEPAPEVFAEVDAVIAECDAKEHFDGKHR